MRTFLNKIFLPSGMSMDLVIEKVTSSNFKDFLVLIDKLAAYEHLAPPDTAARERLMRDGLGKAPKFEAYLARTASNGEAVAYLIFFMTYSSFLALPTLYIEDIFVREEHRRTGIGQKMFEFCVGIAKTRGCGRIEFCVLSWNKPAIRFYKKQGAEQLDWFFFRLTREQIEGSSTMSN